MNTSRGERLITATLSRAASAFIIAALLAIAAPARAQLAGDIVRGQYGLAAGTQAPEGLVLSGWAYDYYTSTIKGPDGNTRADLRSFQHGGHSRSERSGG